MSHAFDARFSATELELEEMLVRLEGCLHASQVSFDGEIIRLHSRGGVPNVLSLATERVETLREVAARAKAWWGVSLYAISGPLAVALGKSDSIEVYLRIFKARSGGRMLTYNENSGAFRARADSDDLTGDLTALLGRICSTLELEMCIYAEEDGEAEAPRINELERRLAEQAAAPGALGWFAVVARRSLSLARARTLAGPWANRVRFSTADYVVLPFLAGLLEG